MKVRRAQSRWNWGDIVGCGLVVLCLFVLLLSSGFLAWHIWEAGRMAFKARDWQGRYARGTTQAYHDAAQVDLALARTSLGRGDTASAEARASSARDKLDAPQFAGRGSPADRELRSLEAGQAASFRPIRVKRAMGRLGKEGAEK
ncbi:MAG: hypothetical protein HY926_08880 [Elusimicrobia bacterium]|nr:hypothetical protein [Elusimicrobiota bacterium]